MPTLSENVRPSVCRAASAGLQGEPALDVPAHRHQIPLALDVFQSSQQGLPIAHHRFDDPKHRLRGLLAQGVVLSPRGGSSSDGPSSASRWPIRVGLLAQRRSATSSSHDEGSVPWRSAAQSWLPCSAQRSPRADSPSRRGAASDFHDARVCIGQINLVLLANASHGRLRRSAAGLLAGLLLLLGAC